MKLLETIRQYAKSAGISEGTVRALVKQDKIPHFYVGNRCYIIVAEANRAYGIGGSI